MRVIAGALKGQRLTTPKGKTTRGILSFLAMPSACSGPEPPNAIMLPER